MKEIPIDSDSGSSGAQSAGSSEIIPPPRSYSYRGDDLTDTVWRIAEGDSSFFKNDINRAIFAATFQQNQQQLRDQLEINQELRNKLESAARIEKELSVRVGILEQMIINSDRSRKSQSFIVFCGTLLAGLGYSIIEHAPIAVAIPISVVGIAMVIYAFGAFGGEQK